VGVKAPAVISAFYLLTIELAAIERHAAMRAGIAKRDRYTFLVTSNDHWYFQ
jgi:hypothetical protein